MRKRVAVNESRRCACGGSMQLKASSHFGGMGETAWRLMHNGPDCRDVESKAEFDAIKKRLARRSAQPGPMDDARRR